MNLKKRTWDYEIDTASFMRVLGLEGKDINHLETTGRKVIIQTTSGRNVVNETTEMIEDVFSDFKGEK